MSKFGSLRKAAPLALAIAAAFGASSANAGLVATSVLEVTNFQIQDGTGTIRDISNFVNPIIQDTGTNTANLTGFASVSNPGSVFGGAPLDIAQACVGGPCPGQNVFSHTVPPPAGGIQLARADSKLDGAPVTGLALPTGANARTVSEVLLTGNGIGGGDSDLGLNVSFVFAVASAQTLRLAFNADLYLRAFLSPDSKIGSSAAATSKLTFNILNTATGANIFSWAPNGVVDAGSITGGAELLDGANLNDSVTALLPGENFSRDLPGSQLFSAETALDAGQYRFTISQVVGADGTQVIPEPGTLALTGVALLGIAALRRQKKTS